MQMSPGGRPDCKVRSRLRTFSLRCLLKIAQYTVALKAKEQDHLTSKSELLAHTRIPLMESSLFNSTQSSPGSTENTEHAKDEKRKSPQGRAHKVT